MLALVAALRTEIAGLLGPSKARLEVREAHLTLWRGPLAGSPVLLAVTGVGRDLATAGTRSLLERYRPSALVNLGFAGALQPELRPGDLVLERRSSEVGTAPEGDAAPSLDRWVEADGELLHMAEQVAEECGVPWTRGEGLTLAWAASTPEEKGRLAATAALTVDMESYWVGQVTQEAGVPFLAVRSVLDTAGQGLPPSVTRLGSVGLWPVLGALAATLPHPGQWPGLLALALQARRAQRSLALVALGLAQRVAGRAAAVA